MLHSKLWVGRRPIRPTCRSKFAFLVVLVFLSVWLIPRGASADSAHSPARLIEKHVQDGQGLGGRWYIPPLWMKQAGKSGLKSPLTATSSIIDAAENALEFALHRQAFLNNSHIPLIVHQTWRNVDPGSWSEVVKGSVEEWLRVAVGDPNAPETHMAWFLWDDDGIEALMKKYENSLYEDFLRLPYPVEKADVFRVIVLKWFGGVYADIDTKPIRAPYEWVSDSDTAPWTEASHELALRSPAQGAYAAPEDSPISYSAVFNSVDTAILSEPSVNAIFGIEADNPPEPDPTYWRMGYTYPIQVTNWALSMAPHHPVADQFIQSLHEAVSTHRNTLLSVDPLDITGPPALTAAVKTFTLRVNPEFSWDSLSGRTGDPVGGRGKIVAGDTLILPITGFNPGRGWFHNMGSQSIAHPNARLQHAAAGSWRKVDVKVHYGKLCRVLFGLCKDWKKIPDL